MSQFNGEKLDLVIYFNPCKTYVGIIHNRAFFSIRLFSDSKMEFRLIRVKTPILDISAESRTCTHDYRISECPFIPSHIVVLLSGRIFLRDHLRLSCANSPAHDTQKAGRTTSSTRARLGRPGVAPGRVGGSVVGVLAAHFVPEE